MSLFEKGNGDYTKERHELFKDVSVDDIVREITIMRKREELENNRDTEK